MPLRPLGLGDLYDGAFKVIRVNPMATVGSAVLVSAVAMLVPVLVTAVLTWTIGASELAVGDEAGDEAFLGELGSVGSLLLGSALQSLGLVLVGGMIAQVVAAAVVGRRLTLAQAWAATDGKRWRLIALALVLGTLSVLALAAYVLLWVAVVLLTGVGWSILFGVISVPLFVAAMFWFWIRVYYLPATVLMLEDVGVLGAISRGYRLTAQHFWRIFGIALLTYVVTSLAASALAAPFSFLTQGAVFVIDPAYALLALAVGQAVGTVVSTAFVGPFVASVTALQYVDLRMRKEGYDVELLARAGAGAR